MEDGNDFSSPVSDWSPGFREGCGKQELSGKPAEGSLLLRGLLQSLGAAQEKAKVFAGKISNGTGGMSYHGLITGKG